MATSKETGLAKYELSKPMQEMMAMATQIAASKIVPLAYAANPAGVFTAIQYGKELGLRPMTALQNIAVINGKPTLGTDMFLGLAMRHPEWGGYEIKPENDKCTVSVDRVNSKTGKVKTFSYTFTMAEARNAGLWKSGGAWDKWPKRMLKHRATAFALRDAFPDVLAGIYTDEEMDPDKGAVEEISYVMATDRIEAEVIEDKGVPVEPAKAEPKIAPKRAASVKAPVKASGGTRYAAGKKQK